MASMYSINKLKSRKQMQGKPEKDLKGTSPKKGLIKRIKNILSRDNIELFAQIATAVGLVFGVVTIWQAKVAYDQNEDMRKKELTIQLINEMYDKDFRDRLGVIYGIVDYFRSNDLKTIEKADLPKAYKSMESQDKLQMRLEEDIYYVVGVFNKIALLYESNALDPVLFDKGGKEIFCDFAKVKSIWPKVKKYTEYDPKFANIDKLVCHLGCNLSR